MMATFFMVSGGPYGLEELIFDHGYSTTLLVLLITPIIWSLPTALMVAELSAAMPAEGGFYVWVSRALGPFWGAQEAWLSLVASVFDMAIYPTLFVAYAQRLWPALAVGHRGVLLGAAVVFTGILWNLLGSRAVGFGSEWLAAVLLAPFAVIVAISWWKYGFSTGMSAASLHPAKSTDFLGGMMVAMWNYMGWDNASTIAGEVEQPQKTYPRMIGGALALVIATYLICVLAMQSAGIPVNMWETGSWADAAGIIAGPTAQFAVAVGGMVCGVGMFVALALSRSAERSCHVRFAHT